MSLTTTTRALQLALGAGLASAALLALRQPLRAEANVGATTVWLLWWPLVPFLALVAGRLWCALCPFAGLSDLTGHAVDRIAPWRRRAPRRLLRRLSAVWLPTAVALLGVAFLALGLEMSGPMTVAVIAIFAAGSASLALFVHERAWCRYACPLGATLGLYASLSRWALRSKANVPDAAGNRSALFRCPAYLNPRRSIDPLHCQLCARCLDAGAAAIARQTPAMPVVGRAEAALAVALTGVLVADTVRMTPVFLWYIGGMLDLLGPSQYRLAVALLPLASIAAVAAPLALLASLTPDRLRRRRSLAAGLVPVALAAQIGLSLQHLAGSGWPALQGLLIELLPVPWEGHLPPAEAYTVLPLLKAAQFAIFALALAAGLVLARRQHARALESSSRAVAVVSTGAFAGLFALPMSLAC